MNKEFKIKLLLILLIVSCASCGPSREDQAATLVAQTMEARGTGTAVIEGAISNLLTMTASSPTSPPAPPAAATPTSAPTAIGTLTPTPEPAPTMTPTSAPITSVEINPENVGQAEELIRYGEGRFNCIDVSPDDLVLAVCRADEIWLYDAQTLDVLSVIRGHTGTVEEVEWSPDGSRLASAGLDWTARIWDADSGAQLLVLIGHTNGVSDVAWNHDGSRLATSSGDETAKIWNATSGELIQTLSEHEEWVNAVAWSPDSTYLLTASDDHKLRIWTEKDGKYIFEGAGLAEMEVWVGQVDISIDGYQAYGTSNGAEVRAGRGGGVSQLYIDDPVRSLAWSPDGTLLAIGDYPSLHIWPRDSIDYVQEFTDFDTSVVGVSWLSDNRQLAAVSFNKLAVLDVETGETLRKINSTESWLNETVWSPDGQTIASAVFLDGNIRLWDFETGEILRELKGHMRGIWALAWSPDGSMLASASNNPEDLTVRIWDFESGQQLKLFEGHTQGIRSVAWSPDGKLLATTGMEERVFIWDIESGEIITTIISADYLNRLAWSPDGTALASAGGDGAVRLWNPQTGKQAKLLGIHADWVVGLEWSPDGSKLASGSRDGTVRIWDRETGEQLHKFEGYVDVSTVAWSPDENLLLAVDRYGGSVGVWDTTTGERLWQVEGLWASYGDWSPDGRWFFVASSSGVIHIFGVPSAETAAAFTATPTLAATESVVQTATPIASTNPLAAIAMNEDDLEDYFEGIYIVDELIFFEQEAGTFLYENWEQRLPPDLINNFATAYVTESEWNWYRHFNQIFVFSSEEEAHTYFLNATSYMGVADLKKVSVPTVGDESFGFMSPWAPDDKNWGGLIWRYHEYYFFLVTEEALRQVWPEELLPIAENMQARLEEMLGTTESNAPALTPTPTPIAEQPTTEASSAIAVGTPFQERVLFAATEVAKFLEAEECKITIEAFGSTTSSLTEITAREFSYMTDNLPDISGSGVTGLTVVVLEVQEVKGESGEHLFMFIGSVFTSGVPLYSEPSYLGLFVFQEKPYKSLDVGTVIELSGEHLGYNKPPPGVFEIYPNPDGGFILPTMLISMMMDYCGD